jgi:hypothetical protein
MLVIGLVLVALMVVMFVFQLLLALGVPWGKAAWGGQSEVLPNGYRVASLAAALFFAFSVLVVLSRIDVLTLIGPRVTNVFFWIYTIYFGIGIFMNAVSKSKVERIWVPVVAAMFALSLVLLIRG